MESRHATVAVIGAGDYIGGAIVKRFAAEGFTAFVGRRNGEKLQPLLQEIEDAGGRAFGRSLDARQEADITAFLQEADREAPLQVCIFNIGANVNFPLLDTTERVFRKVWEMACYSGFLTGLPVAGHRSDRRRIQAARQVAARRRAMHGQGSAGSRA
jgi:NAD(P)-dependent dehydrogenase (short-subunit alcohol dehydrogenase family)